MFPPCLSGRGDVELLQEVVCDEDGDDDADEDGLGVADGDQGAGDDQGLEQRTRSRKIYFFKIYFCTWLMRALKLTGIVTSTMSTSLENRLRMRPKGVVSKKDIGARIILEF